MKSQYSDKDIEIFENQLKKLSKDVFQGARAFIAKLPAEGPQQQVFGFLPTRLTRISPFFPMSKRDMKDRPFEELIWKNSWGTLTVQGRKLSVYDESVLLSVMAMVRKHKARTFRTTRHALLQVMNVKASSATYNALWQALQRLTATNVTIEVIEKKKVVKALTGNMLSWVSADPAKFELEVNPYFFEMFGEGLLTNLDLKFRAALTGDITKSLYRFYEGQRDHSYTCHLLTVTRAVNLNLDLETRRLRSRIRAGLRELRKKGYLANWSLNKSDIITILKSQKPKV